MNKFLTLLACGCIATSSMFAFPSMKDVRHRIVVLDSGDKSYVSKTDDLVELCYTKVGYFTGMVGVCNVTGYTIAVSGSADDRECFICGPGKDSQFEESYLYQSCVVDGGKVEKFQFEEGRVCVLHYNGQMLASWQQWD